MNKIELLDPHTKCETCAAGSFRDPDGSVIHVGSVSMADWSLSAPWQTSTHSGLDVLIRIAKDTDLDELLANRHIFSGEHGETNTLKLLLTKFTSQSNQSYPYVCMAYVGCELVGKLYLDRNPENAIRRNLKAAIIDSVSVSLNWEGRGIADKLIEFAEDVAVSNGGRWIEIGATKKWLDSDKSHSRKGLDSLRSYLRRGYYKEAVYLNKQLEIHYMVSGGGTIIAPRYGNSVVLYKDLQSNRVLGQNKLKRLFSKIEKELVN